MILNLHHLCSFAQKYCAYDFLRRLIDGVPVQVVELTGSPGDVVVTHLHVFHARSPNTDNVPRLMLGKEIRRVGET
jgi:ectoine hydroxylase-related dioxygenase (phytanoyl-CoA dioxygenase family)